MAVWLFGNKIRFKVIKTQSSECFQEIFFEKKLDEMNINYDYKYFLEFFHFFRL